MLLSSAIRNVRIADPGVSQLLKPRRVLCGGSDSVPWEFPIPPPTPPPLPTARHKVGENSSQGAVIGLCIEQRKLLYEQQSGQVLASPHCSPPCSGAVTSPPGRGHMGRTTGPPPATGGRSHSQLISTHPNSILWVQGLVAAQAIASLSRAGPH